MERNLPLSTKARRLSLSEVCELSLEYIATYITLSYTYTLIFEGLIVFNFYLLKLQIE